MKKTLLLEPFSWLKKLYVDEFIGRFDPDHGFLKQAIRTAIGTTLAIIIYRNTPALHEGYWLILSAAFLMQTRLGDSFSVQLITVLICGVVSGILAATAGLFFGQPVFLALYVATVGFLVIYVGLLSTEIAIAGFFINLMVIMSAGIKTTPDNLAERFLMIIVGTLIVFSMCFLWRDTLIKRWQVTRKNYFIYLSEFSKMLSKVNHLKYKIKMTERSKRVFLLLSQLKKVFQLLRNIKRLDRKQFSSYTHWLTQSEKIYHIFKSIIAIDYELDNDLTAPLYQQIAVCLNRMAYQQKVDLTALEKSLVELKDKLGLISQHKEFYILFIYRISLLENAILETVSHESYIE